MTAREALNLIITSKTFEDWSRESPVDSYKVRSEYEGNRKTTCSSRFGRGMQELCRQNPPVKPTPPFSFDHLFPCGMYSMVENVSLLQDFRALGGKSVLMHVAETSSEFRWTAESAGLRYGEWLHCRNLRDVTYLLDKCRLDKAELCGINVEAELETTLQPQVIKKAIDESRYEGQVIIIAYGWVQNNVHVTQQDLGGYPWMLEMFPQDAPSLYPPTEKWPQCKFHAHAQGILYPYQLAGTYGNAAPSWYNKPYSIYPANNVLDWRYWLG